MLSPQEIKQKVERWWNNGDFLSAWLNNESYFPKEIPQIGLVQPSETLSNFEKIFSEQQVLKEHSKSAKGFGYTLVWRQVKDKKIGSNSFIKKILIETEDDFLRLIDKSDDFEKFKDSAKLIINEIGELSEWVSKNPLSVIENHLIWIDLLKVCKYFMAEYEAHRYYIRELPIHVHTKFIENNETIIGKLLDFLIPDKAITIDKKLTKRYGLKEDEPRIRMRYLDKNLYLNGIISDITFLPHEFSDFNVKCKIVVITENIVNFLTFPYLAEAISLWGKGFHISLIKNVKWLNEKQIYYWGDLDAHGLSILSQLKGYFPHAKALMMDFETLYYFQKEWGKGEGIYVQSLSNLTNKELELFLFLKENNIRFEQEKIPQWYVNENIQSILTNLE